MPVNVSSNQPVNASQCVIQSASQCQSVCHPISQSMPVNMSSNQLVNVSQCVNQSASRNTMFQRALCAVAYCNKVTAHIHSFRRQVHVATIQCHKTADVDATEESWKDCKKVITRYELCALCAQTIRFVFYREISKIHFQQMCFEPYPNVPTILSFYLKELQPLSTGTCRTYFVLCLTKAKFLNVPKQIDEINPPLTSSSSPQTGYRSKVKPR